MMILELNITTKKGRSEFETKIVDGLICEAKTNKPLTMIGHSSIYVMSPGGVLYIGKIHKHSGFLAGAEVMGAGHMQVKDGKIISIDRFSGHYAPGRDNFRNVLGALYLNGYRFDESNVIEGGRALLHQTTEN